MTLQSFERTLAILEQQREALRRSLLSLLYLRAKLEGELRRTGRGRAELADVLARARWTTERLVSAVEHIERLRAERVLAHARHCMATLDEGSADERALLAEAEHETELLLAR